MTYRFDTATGTWTVVCEEDHIIESGFLTLTFAMEDVTEDDCIGCTERRAEAQSGIPRDYAEC